MAASAGSAACGPTVERIVSEGVLAAAKIILEARFPTRARGAEQQQHRPWFNIEVEEVEGAAKALERWRREGPSLPLVLEVFLQPWGAQVAGQDRVETLLERWVVHYYPMLPEGPSHLSRSQLSRLNPSSVYKRLVITLRSLYTYLRVLPAYRMYRACKRQRGASFTLGYRLHSTLPGSSAAAAPGARRMQRFQFGPVDTPYGQLRMAVDYQPASTVTILEQTTSPPPLPQIIADYVGGAGAAAGSRGIEGGKPHGSAVAGAHGLRHAMSASAVSPASPSALPPPHAGSPSPPQYAAAQQGQGQGRPGSSPQQGGAGSLGRTAGGWPIRRSWSTSMRGVSPHRTLSQPPSELPSPTTAHDTPYGSAPQAVSLPAMLRTLSTSAGRYLVGSPGGKPPLAKPPRAASGGPAGMPAGRPSILGSSPSSGGPLPLATTSAAAAADEDADSEAGGTDSPCGSAGSGARQSSAPMSIPGRGGGGFGAAAAAGRGRRLRSSNDLWAMHHAAAMHKPLSAPAVSHMQQPAAGRGGAGAAAGMGAGGARGARAGSGAGIDPSEPSPSPPPARLPIIPGTLESESSGSAASSLYPTSCSPQLPFAFTPSAQSQSLAGLGMRPGLDRSSPRLGRTPCGSTGSGPSVPQQAALLQMRALAAAGGSSSSGVPSPAGAPTAGAPSAAGAGGSSGAGFSPSSGGSVTGREVPASTALMRRTSWSSRSSAFSPLAGEGSQPGVGYSVSPMQDPALESMLAGSTPRQFSLAGGGLPVPSAAAPAPLLPGPALGRLQALGRQTGSGAATAGYGGAAQPLLTFPSQSPEMSNGLDEADVLPFALDEGSASPLNPRSPAKASPPLPVSTPPGPAAFPTDGHPAPSASRAGAAAGPAAAPAAVEPAAAPVGTAAPGGRVDTDAAVGAFVRLIQEAPPLRLHAGPGRGTMRAASADMAGLQAHAPPGTSSGSDSSAATCLSDGRAAGGLTLQAGLRQFNRLRDRLQQRGVLVGPCPADA